MRRNVEAAILMTAVLAAFTAQAVPSCGKSLCCAREGAPAIQAPMPCCEPSMEERDARVQPATAAAKGMSMQKLLAATAAFSITTTAAPPRPRVQRHEPSATSPPTPPLFLLNEQFLI